MEGVIYCNYNKTRIYEKRTQTFDRAKEGRGKIGRIKRSPVKKGTDKKRSLAINRAKKVALEKSNFPPHFI